MNEFEQEIFKQELKVLSQSLIFDTIEVSKTSITDFIAKKGFYDFFVTFQVSEDSTAVDFPTMYVKANVGVKLTKNSEFFLTSVKLNTHGLRI